MATLLFGVRVAMVVIDVMAVVDVMVAVVVMVTGVVVAAGMVAAVVTVVAAGLVWLKTATGTHIMALVTASMMLNAKPLGHATAPPFLVTAM